MSIYFKYYYIYALLIILISSPNYRNCLTKIAAMTVQWEDIFCLYIKICLCFDLRLQKVRQETHGDQTEVSL